jgi:hypothetical protein
MRAPLVTAAPALQILVTAAPALQIPASQAGRHAGSRCAPEPLQTPQPAVDLVPTGER